jgi:hypothetical protein
LEDELLTQNSGSASEKDIALTEEDYSSFVETKQAELLKKETDQEIEITQDQLSISKRLLNWRTIVPLVIAIIALVIFAQKVNIIFHFQFERFAGACY